MASPVDDTITFDRVGSLPYWSSLDARARSAVELDVFRSLELLSCSGAQAFCQLRTDDGSATPLVIEAISKDEWLFTLGTDDAPHDLQLIRCPAIGLVTGALQPNGTILLSAEASELRVLLDPQSTQWCLFRGDSSCDLPPHCGSVTDDLNVGSICQSFPFFSHASGYGVSMYLGFQEHLVGGGENFGSVEKRGRVIDILNTDALGTNGQFRYQSTPSFLSSRGYSLSLLNGAPSRIDIGFRRHDVLTWTSSTRSLKLLLSAHPSILQRSKALRLHHGPARQVPAWSRQLWLSRCYYQDQAEIDAVITGALQHGFAPAVINFDARCWMRAHTRTDFVWDTSRLRPYQELMPELAAAGFSVSLWENPYVSSATETLYQEGKKSGFFARCKDSSAPFPLRWVPQGLPGFPPPPIAGLVDFTNPAAVSWWKDLHRPYLRAGVRCFKTDFGEEIPADCIFFDGSSGVELRNRYADLYNKTVMEVITEECGMDGVLWARSGCVETATYPVKWGGDCQTNWSGLRSSLRALLSQAVGGALFWSFDIGGFYGPLPSAEFFTRSFQTGMWLTHARCHGTTPREPWAFGDVALTACQRAYQARVALEPFWRAVCDRAAETGVSVIRPLWLYTPDDPTTWMIEDQFMIDEDVVVAPHLSDDAARNVYLPSGTWIPAGAGILGDISPLRGPRWITCPRKEPTPVFFRLGSGFEGLFRAVFA